MIASNSGNITNQHPGIHVKSFSLSNVNGITWTCSNCPTTTASEVYAIIGDEINTNSGENHKATVSGGLLVNLGADLSNLLGGIFKGLDTVGGLVDNLLDGVFKIL